MNRDEAIKIIKRDMDFLEMVIDWEGIDGGNELIEALHTLIEEDKK